MLNNQTAKTIAVTPTVADVAASQKTIDWHQILKGQFSTLWAITQDRHLGSRATARINGSTWMIKVIESTMLEWLKLWKLQNEDRHGHDMESQQKAEIWQAVQELEQFYATHNSKVPPRLQWLFTVP